MVVIRGGLLEQPSFATAVTVYSVSGPTRSGRKVAVPVLPTTVKPVALTPFLVTLQVYTRSSPSASVAVTDKGTTGKLREAASYEMLDEGGAFCHLGTAGGVLHATVRVMGPKVLLWQVSSTVRVNANDPLPTGVNVVFGPRLFEMPAVAFPAVLPAVYLQVYWRAPRAPSYFTKLLRLTTSLAAVPLGLNTAVVAAASPRSMEIVASSSWHLAKKLTVSTEVEQPSNTASCTLYVPAAVGLK